MNNINILKEIRAVKDLNTPSAQRQESHAPSVTSQGWVSSTKFTNVPKITQLAPQPQVLSTNSVESPMNFNDLPQKPIAKKDIKTKDKLDDFQRISASPNRRLTARLETKKTSIGGFENQACIKRQFSNSGEKPKLLSKISAGFAEEMKKVKPYAKVKKP